MNPHRSRKCQIEYDGHKFDNKDEVERYQLLMMRYRAGEITEPEVHPVFKIVVGGISICKVIPDFQYLTIATNEYVTEDVKPGMWFMKQQTRRGQVIREWKERRPFLSDLYKLKKKLLSACHGIELVEIWK